MSSWEIFSFRLQKRNSRYLACAFAILSFRFWCLPAVFARFQKNKKRKESKKRPSRCRGTFNAKSFPFRCELMCVLNKTCASRLSLVYAKSIQTAFRWRTLKCAEFRFSPYLMLTSRFKGCRWSKEMNNSVVVHTFRVVDTCSAEAADLARIVYAITRSVCLRHFSARGENCKITAVGLREH